MVQHFIFSFLAVLGFCIVFETPFKCCVWASLTGAAGWIVYLVTLAASSNLYGACFASAVVVSIASDVLAVRLKTPATVLFVPGILPIVPGTAIYQAVYYFVSGKYDLARKNLVDAAMISGAIALSIVLVDCVYHLLRDHFPKLNIHS